MGDDAIEEIFVLAAAVRAQRGPIRVLLARSERSSGRSGVGGPGWLAERYERLCQVLAEIRGDSDASRSAP